MALAVINAESASGAAAKAVAFDLIAGSHYQIVKLTFGADGTATNVTETAPLPTKLFGTARSSTPALATAGDAVAMLFDRSGRFISGGRAPANEELSYVGTATNGTATLFSAQGSGFGARAYKVQVTNMDRLNSVLANLGGNAYNIYPGQVYDFPLSDNGVISGDNAALVMTYSPTALLRIHAVAYKDRIGR